MVYLNLEEIMDVLPKLYDLDITLISCFLQMEKVLHLGNSTEALIKFAVEHFHSICDTSTISSTLPLLSRLTVGVVL